MALTKVDKSVSSTPGIVDNSNATAITIDSSERVGIGLSSPTSLLHVRPTSDVNFEVEHSGGNLRVAALNDARSSNVGFQFTSTHFNFLTGNVGIETSTINSGTLGASNKYLEVAGGSLGGSGTIVLSRTTNGNNNEIGGIRYVNTDNADDDGLDADGKLVAVISARSVTSDTNASDDSGADLTFLTKPEAGNLGERMRIMSDGNIFFNKTGHDFDAVGAELFAPTGYMSITRNQGTQLYLHRLNNDGAFVEFWLTNNLEGFIDVSSGTVRYENYSDYRMKKNVSDLGSCIDRVKSLRPVTFEYNRYTGYTHEGFIAHEVQEVLPQAVEGEKDAVNEDGEPIYQSYDKTLLIPLLTKAIQEQQALIEDLQTQINEVKNGN